MVGENFGRFKPIHQSLPHHNLYSEKFAQIPLQHWLLQTHAPLTHTIYTVHVAVHLMIQTDNCG